MNANPNYLQPNLPHNLQKFQIPIVVATEESVKGYGQLISEANACKIEITRWPAQGWRPVDTDSGDEGGTKEGIFSSEWKGDLLYGKNEAVGGHYILGYAKLPEACKEDHSETPQSILLWHANYHPDGGQLFFPLQDQPYLVPVALPGDDIQPENFICFLVPANKGLYIHANIWHEGVFAIKGKQRFLDKQGAVHARVSVDFAREFGCLLEIDLSKLPELILG
ncbi:MAG: ureidoglycolate lyase [Chitinophagaceae bacterium]|uniref:ureidoglycolate lyase n=1 Tax=unclassified Paraflavitalea TaxID=2798305 RepID=UPI003D341D74|nr:ureidoglycolate lyase [Chitinophagaceae bacterium]